MEANYAELDTQTKVDVVSIHSESLEEDNSQEILEGLNGVIVAPGRFSGIEGKISAIQYVREQNIPFLGICLGMQMAVIEYARNMKGMSQANSTEMDPECKVAIIDLMESQKKLPIKEERCVWEPGLYWRRIQC